MHTVLIIDDHRPFLEMMSQVIRREGYDVMEAMDGVEGLRLCRKQPPDVVVTDILMPEKDGLEAIREFKRDYPSVKIIAISGGGSNVQIDYLPLAKKMGADSVLRKPIEPADMIDALREVLKD
jgi:CheY-like chemotaxis protein